MADSIAAVRSPIRAFVLVCLYALCGFGHENVMAGVLPLVVLERGGDAAVVGALVAAYGIPTIVLRPLIGRILDTPWRPHVVRLGATIVGLAPLGYIVASLGSMLAVRAIQGAGWAAYGTGGHAVLARIAPPNRRSELAGYYNAMPALAILVGPALGLWLYTNVGDPAPFVLAASLGLAGLLLTLWLPLEPARADPAVRARVRPIAGMFDPAAIVPMLLIGAFMSVQSLFVIFVPVYARAVGLSLEELSLYYPVYGVLTLVSHLSLGRTSDRIGRWPTIALGCGTALVGLTLATLGGGLGGLLVAGALYGVATALVTATVSAMTMESVPPERAGSAMATYSVGYQLGASIGGAAWGTVIAVAGYPWPFVGGAAMVGCCLLLAARRRRPTPA
ncbi:MAG TPA: MFS transporter [Candidatus Limnocylindrales bacterium]|nr:MFS transporter [Candidatus Limnocylindrales bacterium]